MKDNSDYPHFLATLDSSDGITALIYLMVVPLECL